MTLIMQHQQDTILEWLSFCYPIPITPFSEHFGRSFKFRQNLIISGIIIYALYLIKCYLNLTWRNDSCDRSCTSIWIIRGWSMPASFCRRERRWERSGDAAVFRIIPPSCGISGRNTECLPPAIRPIWESGEALFRRFNIRCYCESGCRYVTMYRKVCNSSVKNGRAAGICWQAARMEA